MSTICATRPKQYSYLTVQISSIYNPIVGTELSTHSSAQPDVDLASTAQAPEDPIAKARAIIENTRGLDDEEREAVATAFTQRYEDARIKDFLGVFAERAAADAQRARARSNGQAPIPETSTAEEASASSHPIPLRRRLLPGLRKKTK